MLAPIDLAVSTGNIVGFSLHPDGSHFLTSIARWPFDIWMLEGFDAPREKTWLERLLRDNVYFVDGTGIPNSDGFSASGS